MERRPVERVRGTQDHWPREARRMEAVRRRLEAAFTSFGYQPIDVPVLEPMELHLRKSGLEIVSKLYAFADQGGRGLCLRPELTASVARAYVAQPAPRLPLKVLASGPVFRYERPSKGRFRQFTQCGVELIGADGALADAEVIFLALHALDGLELRDYHVTVGHVGIVGSLLAALGLGGRLHAFLLEGLEDARRNGVASLRARLEELDPELLESDAEAPPGPGGHLDTEQTRAAIHGLLAEIGAEALGRRNQAEVVEGLLRKLQAGTDRRAVERALGFIERLGGVRGAPADALREGRELLAECGLSDAPLRDLEATVALLGEFGARLANVRLDLGLSRGLQYYTGMVFEVDHAGLGSESQLCGGGRYDDLTRALGGRQPVPALGFAFGVERVMLALEAEGRSATSEPAADIFVVAAAAEQSGYAARVAQALRREGWRADLEVSRRPLRSSLAYADREGFPYVAIAGEAEARAGTVRIRDMAGGAERTVPMEAAGETLRRERWAPLTPPVALPAARAAEAGVSHGH